MEQTVGIEQEIAGLVKELTARQKRDLLGYARSIKNRPEPEPGWKAIQHAKEIGFSSADLAQMQQAIEEACENIEDFPEVNLDE
ncbi:MAG: hypothetical protein ABI700_23590 [Chloroflexota bacterium]